MESTFINGFYGEWLYDIMHTNPCLEARGERSWEKGRGDDPFWGKSVDELKEIEKNNPDSKVRKRAKRIKKQKQKTKKTPNN